MHKKNYINSNLKCQIRHKKLSGDKVIKNMSNMLQSIPVTAVSSCTRAFKIEKHMAAHQEWKVNDMEKVKYMNKVEERQMKKNLRGRWKFVM